MKVIIINGPNLNMLGNREPEIYGSLDFETYLSGLRQEFPDIKIDYFQSNHEGAIIDKLQEAGYAYDAIVLNAAAYSHTSIAISDTLAYIPAQLIEVHISNIYAREAFRHQSLMSKYCKGVIAGFGLEVYRLAIYSLSATGKS